MPPLSAAVAEAGSFSAGRPPGSPESETAPDWAPCVSLKDAESAPPALSRMRVGVRRASPWDRTSPGIVALPLESETPPTGRGLVRSAVRVTDGGGVPGGAAPILLLISG